MPKVLRPGLFGGMRNAVKNSLFMAPLLVLFANSAIAQSPGWRTLPNAPVSTGRMDDVFFINPSVGWVLNNNYNSDSTDLFGEIWKTTDGGATWALQLTVDPYLRSVGFADSLTGWVGTVFDPDSLLYQTTDGGATWVLVQNIPEPRPLGICGISVVNDSVMYASGRYSGPARVIKTTDRGASWTSLDLSAYASALVDCHFFSPDSGFVVGSTSADIDTGSARVLFTSDGGGTWTIRHTGTRPGELAWKIQFHTATTGYVSIEKFSSVGPTYYLKTTDGGQTWSDRLFKDTPYDVQGIGFAGDSLGWIGGWGGDTYETTDAGTSWHLAGFGYIINRFRFLNDKLAYAVGETVYKYWALGDINGDGGLTASDAVLMLNCVFLTGDCALLFTDLNCDGGLSASDAVLELNLIFLGAPVTCPP